MKKTGDKIMDALLSRFRELARPIIQSGSPVNLDNCLMRATGDVRRSLDRKTVGKKEFLAYIRDEEETIRKNCRSVILELEKRERLLEIKMTGVGAILDDFVAKSQYTVYYTLRGNSTVGISVDIPYSGQKFCFNTSFKKVMSDGWQDSVQKDIDEFMCLAGRFGRIRIKNG